MRGLRPKVSDLCNGRASYFWLNGHRPFVDGQVSTVSLQTGWAEAVCRRAEISRYGIAESGCLFLIQSVSSCQIGDRLTQIAELAVTVVNAKARTDNRFAMKSSW